MWSSATFFSVTGTSCWSALLRIAYLWTHSVEKEQFYCSNKTGFRLSARRGWILMALLIILPALIVWNHLGFFLDDVFFPKWKDMKVTRPWFLIGNARSGTTWLHRVLTQSDDNVYTTFRTWEILFAVSVSWKILFAVLYEIDRWLYFGIGYRSIQYIERTCFGHIKTHPIGLMEAEEDEWLMMHIGLAQLLLFFFPACSDLMNPLVLFDYHPDMLPYIREAGTHVQSSSKDAMQSLLNTYYYVNQQERLQMLSLAHRFDIFNYYKQCVQRHLYFHVKFRQRKASFFNTLRPLFPVNNTCLHDPIFVSKNPAFTLRIPTIYAVFPDAKVTCLLRDPVESVPSMVSYISQVWHVFNEPKDEYPNAAELLSFCEAHYLFPLLHLHASIRPPNTWAFVSYHHLRKDLKANVAALLDRLYLQDSNMSKEDQKRLTHSIANMMQHNLQRSHEESKLFTSEHKYSFEKCCPELTTAQLKQTLQVVYTVHKDAFI